MLKIKLLMPTLGLSAIAGVAIPLASCGCGGNTINYTVDSFKDDVGVFESYGYEIQPQQFKAGNTYKYTIDITKITGYPLNNSEWLWNVATYADGDTTDELPIDAESIKLTLDDVNVNFFKDPTTLDPHDQSIYPLCVDMHSLDGQCYELYTKESYGAEGKTIGDFKKLTIEFKAKETKSDMRFYFVENE